MKFSAPAVFLHLVILLLLSPIGAAAADPGDDVFKVVPKAGLPLPGETFLVAGRTSFLIPASTLKQGRAKPWVWYAPTLPNIPGKAEEWMFQQFIDAGIAIAGIDVGESYGSPAGRELYSRLYEEMTGSRGYSKKPVMLGRSRGGLMTLAWAVNNPENVGGFAGVYPVCNVASYPGVARAAVAFELTPDALRTQLSQHNPVDLLEALAKADVPLFAIHGDIDNVVPLDANSGLVMKRYKSLGGRMQLIVPPGQGHNMWPGFFHCEELVTFVKANAK